MLKQRGFTLIELLVVIAIIGILASVVLASLNQARDKGEDAAIKANLANARAQAELYYDESGNSYDGVCDASSDADPAGISDAVDAANEGETGTFCEDTADGWAAWSELSDGGFWCVDSSGTASSVSSAPGTAEC